MSRDTMKSSALSTKQPRRRKLCFTSALSAESAGREDRCAESDRYTVLMYSLRTDIEKAARQQRERKDTVVHHLLREERFVQNRELLRDVVGMLHI